MIDSLCPGGITPAPILVLTTFFSALSSFARKDVTPSLAKALSPLLALFS